jgi:CheY-like chemotaxis protein
MKILVLHNNNLPFFLRSAEHHVINDYEVESKIVKYDSNIIEKVFDSFISEQLSFLKDSDYDAIILPYTFCNENYQEYTGLRVAAHIRLTPAWHKVTTPLIFVGPDSSDDILNLSEIGNIINSFAVYQTSQNSKDELLKVIDDAIKDSKKYEINEDGYLETTKYRNFVRTLNIDAPANYSTHHSIANEWAIIRWIDMFSWKDQIPQIENKSILDMLYFKLLQAKAGSREQFTSSWKKKNQIEPLIRNIKGKKILYIDDEGTKGWNNLLESIFENSGAEFLSFSFPQNVSKNELIEAIELYIDSNDADCYLVDLRLHDDDFGGSVKPEDFTGIKIAKYIKTKNKGNQIIMFTASNKIWNYEEAINNIGILGYAIKESPEYNYTRKESYKNFCHFSDLIKNAVSHSYISEYVSFLESVKHKVEPEQWNTLDNYVDMILMDENRTIKVNILNIMVFLESYLDKRYHLEASKMVKKEDLQTEVCSYNPMNIVISKNMEYVHYYGKPTSTTTEEMHPDIKKEAEHGGKLTILLVALRYKYRISEDYCNKVLKLKKVRNQSVTHEGSEISLTSKDLKDVFDNVVLPILREDYPN